MDRDVDKMLRRNADRQLADFDWDRQRQTVMDRVEIGRAGKPRRSVAVGIAAGAAAVLALAVGAVFVSLLNRMASDEIALIETPVADESIQNDALLTSTDPATILLTGPIRWLALNDPTLAPHSHWDQ